MTDEAKALAALFTKFLGEWGKSRQYGEVIYGLHTGTDREVELTSTSIRTARDLIETQAREIERLRVLVRGWHYLAVGPDEMGDYYTQKALIKASEPYASPALKAIAGDSQ